MVPYMSNPLNPKKGGYEEFEISTLGVTEEEKP